MQPFAYDATTRLRAPERDEADRQLVITIRDAQTALSTEAGSTPKSYGNNAQYRPSGYARRIADAVASEYGLSWVAEWRIAVLGVHCVVLRAADERSRTEAIRRLKQDTRVESVQPMHEFHTTSSSSKTAYNDPYFRLQRQVELLRVPDAHRWSRGKGVHVAVIDTGLDGSHPELAGRVRLARNFVDNDAATFRRDAHGTAVAGVIAAASDNHLGIVGVAPEVQILALKACWYKKPAQVDDGAVCNTLTLAEALAFAIDQRAAVINLSLTGPDDPLLRRLVETALRRGTVVVGADSGTAASAFPIAVPGVLAVGDSDAAAGQNRHARITAPGRDVLTLTPFGHYDYLSGVSLSSAMVTGIVALLLERHRSLAPQDISRLIERTASPTSLSPTALLLVNACSAVASVTRAARCDEQVTHQTLHPTVDR